MTEGTATGAPLAIPGLVYVAPTDALHPATVEIDAAAGWRTPRGIRQWSHEASVARLTDLKESVRVELGLVLPHERIDEKSFPFAHRAAKANPVVAVPQELVSTLVGKGVRVHTIGYDKVTAGFFYFAEGGGEAVRVQGDLIEMLTPILQYGSANEDIERHMGRVVDRLLTTLSDGAVTEARVELADALPPLGKKGENATSDLAEFEGEAKALAEPSKKWEGRARDLVATLEGSATRKESTVTIPLYGEARRVTRTEMELDVGGKRIVLPSRVEWVVSGEISEAPRVAAVAVAPVTAEVDEAWGAESAPHAAAKPSPAVVASQPTPSPSAAVAAKATPSPAAAAAKPTPSPAAARVTPSPATAKVTPSPAARLATPSPSAGVKSQPVGRVGTMIGGIAKPAPSPLLAKDTSSPTIEVKSEPSGEHVRASIEPAEEKPVSPAVVASRIASVSGSGSAPTPETSKPPEEKKKPVEVAQAKTSAEEAAKRPAAASEAAEGEEEEEEEEDDRRHLTTEEKASRKAGKAQRKAERQAARRAAAEAANKAANAPKPKEKRAETKPEKEKAASKSARPAAKEKEAVPAAAPAESAGSSFGTIAIVLVIMLAAAAAIWWFVLRKH